MEQERIDSFIIKNPRWALYVSVAFLIFGAMVAVAFTVLFCLNVVSFGLFIAMICASVLFMSVWAIGIFLYFKEKFIFENETFTYYKAFKKNQSAKIEDVAEVVIRYRLLIKVVMYDTQGKAILNFLDDGTAFLDGKFRKVLQERNITVTEKGKNGWAWYFSLYYD